MSKHPRTPPFTPASSRRREDGWTPERQVAFIEALAATANVQAACKAVGMSTSSAYELRARPGSASFREAWTVALDYAVHRLGEAALDRALNGTATPVFYKGEQVGERRRFDEKLTMFVLRLRDPERFGTWREAMTPMTRPGQAQAIEAARLALVLARLGIDADRAASGLAVPARRPLPGVRLLSPREVEAWELALAERVAAAHERRQEAASQAAADAAADADAADEGADLDTAGGM